MDDSPHHPIRATLLGAGFMGQMHALAFADARRPHRRPAIDLHFDTVIDAEGALAEALARRCSFQHTATDWRGALARADTDLFINAAPNFLHHEPCVEAAKRGLHVFCEKPLGRTAAEALDLWRQVEKTGRLHMCGYLHRFLPALRKAREVIAAGGLGTVRCFRSVFLLDMIVPGAPPNWRFRRSQAGGGALGDLGSHHFDLARYLVGEIASVQCQTAHRPADHDGDPAGEADANDDWFGAVAELENGATATFEASRVSQPHALTGRIEVDGTRASLSFDMERLNELVVREGRKGPRTELVLGPDDPYADFHLPVGLQGSHPIGWRDAFAFQARHFLEAVALGSAVGPHGATFRDGYRVAAVVDAALASAQSGRRVVVRYDD